MTKLDEYKPDNLIAGDLHRATAQIILKSGRLYPVGAVIAKTANGTGTLIDSAGDNKTIYGILAEEVDATAADTGGIVYLSGEFNQNALVFGGSDTYETHIDEARTLGLYFVDSSKQNIID